jgi:MFS transporter, PPP family, 3-phenylpropionic acid transporter
LSLRLPRGAIPGDAIPGDSNPGGGVRLGLFWFVYLAGMGVFFPFASLYLRQRLGFGPAQVGTVLAMVPLAGMLTLPLWGQLADRSGSRRGVLALLAAGAAAGALVLGGLRGYPQMLLGVAAFAAFHASVFPMATAITLAQVGTDGYGRLRMWGTVGFLTLVVSFPALDPWLARITGRPASELGFMFPTVALLSILAAVLALGLPRSPALALKADPAAVRRLLRYGPMVRLLVFAFVTHSLIQGPIYLFPLYLASRGGDAALLGRTWILMLLLEIPLIAFSGRVQGWLGPRGLLRLGLGTEALRWLICGFTTHLPLVMAAQLLHGVGVAGILIGAPLYAERVTPQELRSTSQALVAMAGASAGAIVSTSTAGWLMEHVAVEAPYLAAGFGTAFLALFIRRILPDPRQAYGSAEPGGRIGASS